VNSVCSAERGEVPASRGGQKKERKCEVAKKKKGLDPNIRRMVCANHGGLDNADGAAILAIWNSLDEATRNRYAEEATADSLDGEPKSKPGKGGNNADSN